MTATVAKKKPSRTRLAMRELQKMFQKIPEQRAVPKKSQGKFTQLGICQFIACLLKANEDLPKNKKLNDATITKAVAQEFPTAKSVKRLIAGHITIGYWRTLYNLGHFSPEKKAPKVKSKQYNEKGEVINPRSGKPVA